MATAEELGVDVTVTEVRGSMRSETLRERLLRLADMRPDGSTTELDVKQVVSNWIDEISGCAAPVKVLVEMCGSDTTITLVSRGTTGDRCLDLVVDMERG